MSQAFPNIGRTLSDMWHQVSHEEKQKFFIMAADDEKRYKNDLLSYKGAAPAADNDDVGW
jgi:hypothetical protein